MVAIKLNVVDIDGNPLSYSWKVVAPPVAGHLDFPDKTGTGKGDSEIGIAHDASRQAIVSITVGSEVQERTIMYFGSQDLGTLTFQRPPGSSSNYIWIIAAIIVIVILYQYFKK